MRWRLNEDTESANRPIGAKRDSAQQIFVQETFVDALSELAQCDECVECAECV